MVKKKKIRIEGTVAGRKVMAFKKYRKAILSREDREFRKELYALRERQKSAKIRSEARIAAGEVKRLPRKFKRGESRKVLTSRARRFSALAGALGATTGRGQARSGPGRPKGTYKYRIGGRPASVFEWRKFQAQRKMQLSQMQQQQDQRLATKGFQPEQLQALRQQKIIQQAQQGGRPVMQNNVADQEADFQDHLAKTTVSPRTQQILVNIRRIQNKGRVDNIEQQRRQHERKLVGQQMNLMKAHENMIQTKMDFTGVNSENVLMAPSVFKENAEDNILRSNRPNILQTREAGNTLGF